MSAVIAFVKLSRVKFLAGGLLGVALGAAIANHAWHSINWISYALAQVAVTSFQLMTHYTNDYFDREGDCVAVRTWFSGGSGVLPLRELSPRVAMSGAVCALTIGIACIVMFLLANNVAAFVVGVAIALLAWFYSSPPLRLHSRGAGEVATAVVVGVLVPLFSYVCQTGAVSLTAVLATLPAAFAMFIMMIGVEIPDIAADEAAGKRNLLVRYGRGLAPALIAIGASGIVAGGIAAYLAGAPWTILVAALIVIPLCGMQFRNLRGKNATDASIAAFGVVIFTTTIVCSIAAYLTG